MNDAKEPAKDVNSIQQWICTAQRHSKFLTRCSVTWYWGNRKSRLKCRWRTLDFSDTQVSCSRRFALTQKRSEHYRLTTSPSEQPNDYWKRIGFRDDILKCLCAAGTHNSDRCVGALPAASFLANQFCLFLQFRRQVARSRVTRLDLGISRGFVKVRGTAPNLSWRR